MSYDPATVRKNVAKWHQDRERVRLVKEATAGRPLVHNPFIKLVQAGAR